MYLKLLTPPNLISLIYRTSLPARIDETKAAPQLRPSREAAKECSPRLAPWVESRKRPSPEGAEEPLRYQFRLRYVFVALLLPLLPITILLTPSHAATKSHIITFGKWMDVNWITPGDEKPVPIKVRPLIIDTRVKEYVTGPTHEITERLFVVRRAFRVNDSLPGDPGPKWQWQRGGWLLIDRTTGRISAINLPEFDPLYSAASWYRDYVAYCGVSDDGKKIFAMVAQLNRRKAVLKKPLPGEIQDDSPDSACPAPDWQRSPARVTFLTRLSEKQTFAIRGHVVDVVNDDEEE